MRSSVSLAFRQFALVLLLLLTILLFVVYTNNNSQYGNSGTINIFGDSLSKPKPKVYSPLSWKLPSTDSDSLVHRNQYVRGGSKSSSSSTSIPKKSNVSVNLWRRVVTPSLSSGPWNIRKGKENHIDIQGYHQDDRILKQLDWIKTVSTPSYFQNLKHKKILVLDGFDSYYGLNGRITCPGDTGSNSANSFSSKCSLVEDNWYTGFFRDLEAFDAVVGIRNWVYRIYEGKLPGHVRQFLFTLESPYVTKYADFSVNNAVLASYWRGSDITVPYNKWVSYKDLNKTSLHFISNSFHNTSTSIVNVRDKDQIRKNSYNFKSRRKLAAIVVSDCTPQNERLKYVEELRKFIPIDVYGRCGDKKCGKDCFLQLRKEYKFYLAFENANCRDYITEKFFINALQHDLVPVVLGAHKKDYEATAPPHSFIHVEDFKNPEELAKYLNYLNENETAYNKYFEWHNKGQFLDHWQYFFCRVCALLHYADVVKPPVWPKESTWKNLNECLPPGRWYWEREN